MLHAKRGNRFKAVELSTYGINFLGTPHQGNDNADLGNLLLLIQSIYSDSNNAVLWDLKPQTAALQQQLSQYAAISGTYNTKFFFETLDTPLRHLGGIRKRVHRLLYSNASISDVRPSSSFPNSPRLCQARSMQRRFLCIKTMRP